MHKMNTNFVGNLYSYVSCEMLNVKFFKKSEDVSGRRFHRFSPGLPIVSVFLVMLHGDSR